MNLFDELKKQANYFRERTRQGIEIYANTGLGYWVNIENPFQDYTFNNRAKYSQSHQYRWIGTVDELMRLSDSEIKARIEGTQSPHSIPLRRSPFEGEEITHRLVWQVARMKSIGGEQSEGSLSRLERAKAILEAENPHMDYWIERI